MDFSKCQEFQIYAPGAKIPCNCGTKPNVNLLEEGDNVISVKKSNVPEPNFVNE